MTIFLNPHKKTPFLGGRSPTGGGNASPLPGLLSVQLGWLSSPSIVNGIILTTFAFPSFKSFLALEGLQGISGRFS
jgi:hypothetical protein